MSIADTREKCKVLVARIPRDILILLVIVLASLCSFGFGYLAGLDAEQGSGGRAFESPADSEKTGTTLSTDSVQVVASKSGTKYYLTSCAGANRISSANKVTFASAAAAQAAGYSPAANCSGF